MILRLPGLYQEGSALAIGSDGGGAAVGADMWDTAASGFVGERIILGIWNVPQ
jgi:hypothetical protein